MKKTITTVNGNQTVRYQFSAAEKEALAGYIPVNPCKSCPTRAGCCGCPKETQYSEFMNTKFFGDRALIFLASQIASARQMRMKIEKEKKDLDAYVSSLPAQVRSYTKYFT